MITGGAGQLGKAIAQDLAAQGAKVIVIDIDAQALAITSAEFETYQVDITDYAAVQNNIDTIIKKHKKIDVLINNAGLIHSEPLVNITRQGDMKHSYESFKNTMKINMESVFIMTSIVAEKMIMNRTKGCVVNISSISAKGNAGQTAYSAAKGAVESMTKTWGKELAMFGIRTNAIAPGFIDTSSTSLALNEKTIKHIVDNTPLRRLGTTENICQAVSYLIENEFVNAAILPIDGGLTL